MVKRKRNKSNLVNDGMKLKISCKYGGVSALKILELWQMWFAKNVIEKRKYKKATEKAEKKECKWVVRRLIFYKSFS